ncbi:MAG TPA: hypothetical protein DIU45_15880 [Clostridium sp.]|nr:hypothetical protein [Clostridium sp.]
MEGRRPADVNNKFLLLSSALPVILFYLEVTYFVAKNAAIMEIGSTLKAITTGVIGNINDTYINQHTGTYKSNIPTPSTVVAINLPILYFSKIATSRSPSVGNVNR